MTNKVVVLMLVLTGCASTEFKSHPHFIPDQITHQTEYLPIDDKESFECVKDIDIDGKILKVNCSRVRIK